MHLQPGYRMTRSQWRSLVEVTNPNGVTQAISRLRKVGVGVTTHGAEALVNKPRHRGTKRSWRFENGRLVGR